MAPLIEVRNLSKNYGPVRALDQVSFSLDEGEILGFLGPNGAGKTTALRILAGFLPGDDGTVRIAGRDVREEPVEVRQRLGYLPEGVPLYPEMRVSEYLRFRSRLKGIPFRNRRRQVEQAMARTGVQDVHRRIIGTLSRGYRQRVGLADALLGEPQLLILDEPTVGLDPEQVRQFRALLRDVGRDRTVILSTHILSEVERVCSNVLIINKGRIEASDTADRLRQVAGSRATRVVVEIAGPRKAVMAALEALPGVSRVERASMPPSGAPDLEATGESPAFHRFQVYTPDNVDARLDVFDAVQRNGWSLRHLQREREEPSIEDIFMDIVRREG